MISQNEPGYSPSHPELFEVAYGDPTSFTSRLIAKKEFPAGAVVAPVAGCHPTHTKAYSSVQIARDPTPDGSPAHVELCSDLLYVNHGCDPNIAFEVPDGLRGMEEGRWKVRAIRDIGLGEALSFAYFSTEWEMEQPFLCNCGSKRCLGIIRGAKYVPYDILQRYFVNEHIAELKENERLVAAHGREPGRKTHAPV